jgi:pimeloyl-ACP methyl ester carboxylesterase
MPDLHHFFADSAEGQIHGVSCGDGPAVVLLHQTPRSWDEFRDVLPVIGRTHRAIALDTIGFGESDKPARRGSVELYAAGVLAAIRALGLGRVSLVGHHTGGIVAVEVAASIPDQVERLVLSATGCIDAARRSRNPTPTVDEVPFAADGSHLLALWNRRRPYYPPGRPDLLQRFVTDALKVFDRVEEGHQVVGEYHMELRLPRITCPVLLICGTEDWAAAPAQERLAGYLPGSELVWVPGAGVAMVDEVPGAFAAAVLEFLSR